MDMKKLMEQAAQVQEKMQDAQSALDNKTVIGESGAGLVKVETTCRHKVVSVSIDDSVFQEDKSVLEDLIAAAVNTAVENAETASREMLQNMTSGMDLQGDMKDLFGGNEE